MKKTLSVILAATAAFLFTAAPPASGAVGDTAPAITEVTTLKGADVTRGFQAGTVYAVTIWSTWCPSSLTSLPLLTRLQKTYAGKAVIIGLCNEPPATISALTAKMGGQMDFTVLADTAGRTGKAYMQHFTDRTKKVVPVTFIVDGAGKIAWIGHPSKMEAKLKELTGGETAAAAPAPVEQEQDTAPVLQNKQVSAPAPDAQKDEPAAPVIRKK